MVSKIMKKNREHQICQLLGDAVMIIQKLIIMSQKVGCQHGMKTNVLYITYFIYYIRNQYSSSLHSSPPPLITPASSLRKHSLQFVDFHSVPCVSLLTFSKSIILAILDLRISSNIESRSNYISLVRKKRSLVSFNKEQRDLQYK